MNFIGELALLLTSAAWAGTLVLFTKATQHVGSIIVKHIRLIRTLASVQGKAGESINNTREQPKMLGVFALAALTGPVLGVTLSFLV